jgi:hypothetical protein
MALDLNQSYNDINSKISSFKSTVNLKKDEAKSKLNSAGNTFEQSKSDALKQLNNLGDTSQRLQNQIKSQFDQIVGMIKSTMPNDPTSGSDTVSFLIELLLNSAKNTKHRISEVFLSETISTIGCSQEQTFEVENSIYIDIRSIDLFRLLPNSYELKPFDIFYEKNDPVSGQIPFSMDKKLYDLTQNGGVNTILGVSQNPLFDIQYVTEYTENGIPYFGDFYKIDLKQRVNGNNISDFLVEYYKTIDIVNFDVVLARIFDSLQNIVSIKGGVSIDQVEKQTKFDKMIQRILGLCFDSNTEIDVSGNAKQSVLDQIDESFFDFTSSDLNDIDSKIENIKQGVTEFTDCENIKFPVNVDSILDSIDVIREVPDNRKTEVFMGELDKMINDEWKKLGLNLDLNVKIKTDILNQIIQSVSFAVLSPKSVLGLMIGLKSLKNELADNVEDIEDFMKDFKSFFIELCSKIGAIFIEELVKILKRNIRRLVETLLKEIATEAKDARIKMIASILFILLQVVSAIIDFRQCKSLVDEIQNLLNLARSSIGVSLPSFALANAGILGGFSPTRALSNVVGNLESQGIPTGALPDGSPNVALNAMQQMIKGVNDEELANSKVEVFIPPLAVAALGGGTTLPGRGIGKKM